MKLISLHFTIRLTVDQFICHKEPKFDMENYPFNYTKNSDFVETLRKITRNDIKPVFDRYMATFNRQNNTKYAEMITSKGIGFTFNMADDLLNFDM